MQGAKRQAKAIREFVAHATAEKEAAATLVGMVHDLHALSQRMGHVLTGSRDAWVGDVLDQLLCLARDLDPDIRYCEHDQERKLGACVACGVKLD